MSAARSRRANDKHNHLQRTPILVMGCSLLIACCIAFGGTNWTASAQPSEDQLPEQNAIVEPGYYQETIGSYEAISQSDDDERAENLRLAAEAINGYVIEPGATFSFNEVVGDTTAERGYKEAPVLYSSGLGSSDGGGICQVSTALYIAAVKADLEIVERFDPLPGAFRSALAQRARPHSAATPVGTLPTGIEALERSLAAARAERVETFEPVERSVETAARELLEGRQVRNQHHGPRTVTHLRSVPSFLKPPIQLGRQVLTEQGQVERSERVLMRASALLLVLELALVSLPMLVPKLASKPALTLERSEMPAGLLEGPQQLEVEALAAHRLRA